MLVQCEAILVYLVLISFQCCHFPNVKFYFMLLGAEYMPKHDN